jgi:subtilase family serine protease
MSGRTIPSIRFRAAAFRGTSRGAFRIPHGPLLSSTAFLVTAARCTAPLVSIAALFAFGLSACGSGGGGGGPGTSGDGPGGGNGSLSDLIPLAVSFQPATAVAGTPISVSDTIKNQGGGAAHDFQIGIYLSTDAIIGAGDRLLGFRTIGSLASGASSSGGGSLTVPVDTPPGNYFVGAWVDDAGHVNELTETNNTQTAGGTLATSIAILPNIAPRAIAFTQSVVEAGRTVDVSDTVENRGTASAAAFQVGVYLSTDADVTTADKLLGLRPIASLAIGAQSTAADALTIPSTTSAGSYYLGVIADVGGAVAELDELDNRLVASAALTITTPPRPDLVMVSVSFSPGIADTGTPIQVSESVTNQGDVDASAFRVGIYLSSDPTIDDTDVWIGARTVLALAVGDISVASTECIVPIELAGGTWYVGAIADDEEHVGEIDDTNNEIVAAPSITLTVPPRPDLVISSISFQPSQIDTDAGQVLHATELARNLGTFSASAFRVGIYLSANNVITKSDVLLGSRSIDGLAIGDGSGAASDLVLPSGLSPGTYFVGAIADDMSALLELTEANNVLVAAGTLDVIATPDPMPDLVVSNMGFGPSDVMPGGTVQLQTTIRNEGDLSAGTFKLGLYLSTDEEISVDDLRIGQRTVFQLGIDFGSASSAPYTVPGSVVPGDYYVGAIADFQNSVAESEEANNWLKAPGRLRVYVPPPPSPDLVVASLSFTPAQVAPGGSISVSSTVENQGALPASSFRVGYYLSTDGTVDTSDVLLGFQSIAGLSAEQEFHGTASFDVPANLALGPYTVGAIADDEAKITEGSDSNNTTIAATPLQVQ